MPRSVIGFAPGDATITRTIVETARQSPDLPAFIRDGAPMGYAALARQIAEASDWLAGEGIRPGDTVGITLRDEWLNILVSLALLHRGARQVTLAPHETASYRADLAARLGAVAVVGDAPADAPGATRLLLPDPGRFDAAAGRDGVPAPGRGGEVVFFTSGTTGQPRLMTMTEAMLVSQAAPIAARGLSFHRQISYDGNHAKRLTLRSLVTGGTEVLSGCLGDDGLGGLVARFGVQRVHLSPQRAETLVEEDGGRVAAAWPGACIFTTGARITQALRLRIQQALRAPLFIQYGTTEFGTVSIAGPDDHALHPDAAGPLQPGVEIEVLDDAGRPLPAGEEGLLRFRRPEGVVDGYLDDPAATARAFVDGWFVPGDIGRIRPDGQLLVAGRRDDMMNLGGIKVMPHEIEGAAEGFAGLVECAAFAWRSAGLGDVPMIAVVPGPGFEAKALLAHCRARLGVRAPRRVLEVPALPRNAQGKVLRRDLAAMAGAPR